MLGTSSSSAGAAKGGGTRERISRPFWAWTLMQLHQRNPKNTLREVSKVLSSNLNFPPVLGLEFGAISSKQHKNTLREVSKGVSSNLNFPPFLGLEFGAIPSKKHKKHS